MGPGRLSALQRARLDAWLPGAEVVAAEFEAQGHRMIAEALAECEA